MISDTGKNLVFIFSLPRSGSTLLSVVLGSHSTVYCPPEPWILLRLAEVYGNAAENKIYDDYVAGKAVKAFLNEKEFMTSARVFAQATYNSILTKTNHRVFVDKTPRYYHILDFIETLFPAAKKIWLKRNPLDVAASYKITWNRGIDFLVGENPDPVSFDFILGLPNLGNYFAQKSPEKLEVKYEDLVTFPEKEIKKIADFCGLEFESAMLDLSGTAKGLKLVLNSEFGDKKIKNKQIFDRSSIGHWQEHLGPDEIKKLISFIGGDIFLRMGYEETVTHHPEFFDPAVNAEVIKKAREKILGNFEHLKALQIAHIYDLESKIRHYRDETQKSHEQRAKLTEELKTLEKTNIEKISLIKELETKLHNLEEERNRCHNMFKEQEQFLAASISEYRQKLDLLEAGRKEKELQCIHIETLLQQERTELRQMEEQYLKIRYSYSYRIGMALLFPFIKIRDWSKRLT